MATVTQTGGLPRGVGQLTRGWRLFMIGTGALVLLGLFAYSREFSQGMTVTGMRNVGTMGGATWGLYITFVVYFVGVSFAGITIAVVIRLLNLTHLRPLARMAELLTVVSLVLGAIAIIVDLGQPLRGSSISSGTPDRSRRSSGRSRWWSPGTSSPVWCTCG